jgi:putative aldouronate transport system permease protein
MENRLSMSQNRSEKLKLRAKKLLIRIWKARMLYLLLLPTLIYFFIFRYYPYWGLTMAFKDFKPGLGIEGSPWVGFENFEKLVTLPAFGRVLGNTVIISVARLVFGMPIPIIFALLLNEVRHLFYKRIVQTVTYFPHFLSWVIYGGIMLMLLSPSGVVPQILEALTNERWNRLLADTRYFRTIIIATGILKEFGWSAILYLAAMTAIDPTLYDAARVDGANRWQQIRHITIPGIMGVITIVLILNVGHILDAGFGQIFVMENPSVYSVVDIIDTYIYRIGLVDGEFSRATALGLFKGVFGFILIVSSNQIIKRMGRPTIW